ncbi:MAG: HAMP domain-containing sensor histidine kinase, partial [Bacteroidota bacterium]
GHSGMVLDANEAAVRLFGYPLTALLTMHHTELHPLAHREAYDEGRRFIVTEKQAYSQGEAWALHRDGREIPIDVTSTVQEVDGVVLVQGILRDATQRRQHEATLTEARDAAEAASRLKSSLLANMSHELRTPLTAIIGFAEVIAEALEDRGDHEFTEYTRLISQGGERLLTTLNSVLEFARLEAGREPLQLEPFDLHTRLDSIVSFFLQQASKKGLALRFVPATEAPCPVVLDPHGLERAVINLVSNAIKFTQRGEVRLGLATEGDRVQITVEDTGIGISPAFMERLFDEFEQESAGISRRHEGSGLGLAITKRLIERMGGTIAVTSTQGVGTWFTIDLPRTMAVVEPAPGAGYLEPVRFIDVPAPASPAPASPARAGAEPTPRVLLADAEPTTEALFRHLLPAPVALDVVHPAALSTALDGAAAGAWPSVVVVAAASAERCRQAAEHVRAQAATRALARPHLVWLAGDAVPSPPDGIDSVLTRPFTRSMVAEALAGVFAP